MSMPVYLLTNFSCCEDFENYLLNQNHANRRLLDSLTDQVIGEWNKKATNLAVKGSNLCLLDKDGQTLAFVPAILQDGDTITRNPDTGEVTCVRIKAMGADATFGVWVGTYEAYKALTRKSHADTLYFFTDKNLASIYDDLSSVKTWMDGVVAGTGIVPKAEHAATADSATDATNATNATNATHATTADSATHATKADSAETAKSATTALNATNATNATKATRATLADSASRAAHDSEGNQISLTYANFLKPLVKYIGQKLDEGTYHFVVEFGTAAGSLIASVIAVRKANRWCGTTFYVTKDYWYTLRVNTDGTVDILKSEHGTTSLGTIYTGCTIYYRPIGVVETGAVG